MEIAEKLSVAVESRKWAERHQTEVKEVANLLSRNNFGSTKAVLIEGPVHSGKTSLALAVTDYLKKQAPEGLTIEVFFTTPAIQETLGAKEDVDRTGAKYSQLPPPEEIIKVNGRVIIVLDEISQRGPYWTGMWESYINLPNTNFLLLTHPNRPNAEKWLSLFRQSQTAKYNLSPRIQYL